MHLKPALAQRSEHAHRLNGFGVMQVTGGQLAGLLGKAGGFAQGLFGHRFVEAGKADQQHCTHRGKHAKPDIEQINHQQIDRKPRRIEEGKQCRAGDELANMSQVAQGLPGVAFALEQVALERGLIDPQVETALQLATDTDDDEAAHTLQQADERKEPDDH
ncbi:hypothetical protein D3C84_831610 [compost metagenome]